MPCTEANHALALRFVCTCNDAQTCEYAMPIPIRLPFPWPADDARQHRSATDPSPTPSSTNLIAPQVGTVNRRGERHEMFSAGLIAVGVFTFTSSSLIAFMALGDGATQTGVVGIALAIIGALVAARGAIGQQAIGRAKAEAEIEQERKIWEMIEKRCAFLERENARLNRKLAGSDDGE